MKSGYLLFGSGALYPSSFTHFIKLDRNLSDLTPPYLQSRNVHLDTHPRLRHSNSDSQNRRYGYIQVKTTAH
jgi:hypothetical protein